MRRKKKEEKKKEIPRSLKRILKQIREFWEKHPGSFMGAVSAYDHVAICSEMKSEVAKELFKFEVKAFKECIENHFTATIQMTHFKKFENDMKTVLIKANEKNKLRSIQHHDDFELINEFLTPRSKFSSPILLEVGEEI